MNYYYTLIYPNLRRQYNLQPTNSYPSPTSILRPFYLSPFLSPLSLLSSYHTLLVHKSEASLGEQSNDRNDTIHPDERSATSQLSVAADPDIPEIVGNTAGNVGQRPKVEVRSGNTGHVGGNYSSSIQSDGLKHVLGSSLCATKALLGLQFGWSAFLITKQAAARRDAKTYHFINRFRLGDIVSETTRVGIVIRLGRAEDSIGLCGETHGESSGDLTLKSGY